MSLGQTKEEYAEWLLRYSEDQSEYAATYPQLRVKAMLYPRVGCCSLDGELLATSEEQKLCQQDKVA
jgi:hypothetical protein